MLFVEGSSEIGLFRHLSNHVFGVRKFKNTSAISVIFFIKIFKIQSKFTKSKKEKNMEKIFFVPEIIGSENVAVNCLY